VDVARDIGRSQMVEKELDQMIERRSRKGEVDPDEREEDYKGSVRRYNAPACGAARCSGIRHVLQSIALVGFVTGCKH
jgi:hypothetical protein